MLPPKEFMDEYYQHDGVKFDNIFTFMTYCHNNNLTPDNSDTFYDEDNDEMYIKLK